jgi:hypothetical protein
MLLDTPLLSDAVSYHVLGDDIHYVRVLEYSRQSIATFTAVLHLLYASTDDEGALYLLIDCSEVQAAQMAHIWDSIDLIRHSSSFPPVVIALMRSNSAGTLDAMLRPLRSKSHIHLFNPDERDRAVAWLLSKQLETKAKATAEQFRVMDIVR